MFNIHDFVKLNSIKLISENENNLISINLRRHSEIFTYNKKTNRDSHVLPVSENSAKGNLTN